MIGVADLSGVPEADCESLPLRVGMRMMLMRLEHTQPAEILQCPSDYSFFA
jgi:hypothetical protein